jgi:hypothetical protein
MTALRLACLALLAVSVAPAGELSLEQVKFKFEVALEQMDKEATVALDKAYRKGLGEFRQSYQQAGNLDAVLEIKSVAEAFDAGRPPPAITLPKVKGWYEHYLRRKAEALHAQTLERGKLYGSYLHQLRTIEKAGGKDAVAATREIAAARLAIREVEREIRFTPGTKIRGQMHIDIDDKVTFYINGKRLKTFRRGPKNKGKFISPDFDLTVGDRLLASVRNSGGGLRHAKFIFVSEDEKHTIEFKVADFVDLQPVIADRRDFTQEELTSDAAIPARKDADKSGNPFAFENGSEWVWGKGNHSLLATVIKPEMCHVR